MAQTEFGANVGLRLVHSDNVNLAVEGLEESARVSEVTAGFDFSRSQSRMEAGVSYQAQGFYFDDIEDADQVLHQLSADAEFELAEERLFFDTFALHDQTVVDPAGDIPFNNLVRTNNRTDVKILGAGPRLSLDIGSRIEGELSYTWTEQDYDDPDLLTGTEEATELTLGSTRQDGGTWAIAYDHQRYEYGSADDLLPLPGGAPGLFQSLDVEFETFEAELGYWVTPGLRLFTTQGLEQDYRDLDNTGPFTSTGLDLHYWYVGIEWQPNERNTLTVESGQRSFDRAYSLEWNRDMRAGGIAVTYIEEPNTFARGQLQGARISRQFSPINSLDGPIGNRLFLQKRVDVTFSLEGTRNSTGIRFFRDRRFDIVAIANNLGSDAIEDLRGTEVNFDHQFSTRLSLVATARLAERASSTLTVDDTIRYLTVELAYQLGQRTDLSFLASRQQRKTAAGSLGQNYTEDQISVQIQRRFGDDTGGGSAAAGVAGYLGGGGRR